MRIKFAYLPYVQQNGSVKRGVPVMCANEDEAVRRANKAMDGTSARVVGAHVIKIEDSEDESVPTVLFAFGRTLELEMA